jgi:tryptophan halogenase
MHRILGHDERSSQEYNRSFRSIMNNVRDFIALHYITNRKDTPFWIDNQNSEIPDTLGEKLEHWRNHMPTIEDFQDESRYHFFASPNYTMVLEGLDLFDKESIRKEFVSLSPTIQAQAAEIIKNEQIFSSSIKKISHKKFIEYIREI